MPGADLDGFAQAGRPERIFAARHPNLRLELVADAQEIWLLIYPELRHLPRIAAVIGWVERTLRPGIYPDDIDEGILPG